MKRTKVRSHLRKQKRKKIRVRKHTRKCPGSTPTTGRYKPGKEMEELLFKVTKK